MNIDDVKRKLEEDENYVFLKRFDFSLTKLMERYPDGCPDRIIANALVMEEDDVPSIYDLAIEHLRELMGVPL